MIKNADCSSQTNEDDDFLISSDSSGSWSKSKWFLVKLRDGQELGMEMTWWTFEMESHRFDNL